MTRFFFLFFLLTSQFAKAQDNILMSLFDTLFASGEIKLILTYPFDSLYRAQQEDIEATITIETDHGILLKDTPITINLRGKFRRMKCTMPPLMLDFKKSTLRSLGLSPVDEIKLVTHCMEGPEGQENLQEERLCYQVYEGLTRYAYRTIWLTVEYIDTKPTGARIHSAGFLLEPDKVLSKRLGVKERKVFNVLEDSLHFETYSMATAFNFLIGNRDWSVIASRNAKLFYDTTLSQYIVIPYDFDYANIVGASYRRETLPKSMTHPFDRIFEGEYFKDRPKEILSAFQAFEDTVIHRVKSVENPLDETRRKKIARYFTDWFRSIRKARPEDIDFGMICPYNGDL